MLLRAGGLWEATGRPCRGLCKAREAAAAVNSAGAVISPATQGAVLTEQQAQHHLAGEAFSPPPVLTLPPQQLRCRAALLSPSLRTHC